MAIVSIRAYNEINMPETTHDFVLEFSQKLSEYNFTAYLYKHKTFETPFLHIKTSDPQNFFSVAFKTINTDGSGISHVLEHLVLHGSEKYSAKSVSSLINALTSIEWTAYPYFATNKRDFFNLLDIYLDSIFHPRITEELLKFECHHLEFEVPNNKSTPLKHAGNIYNEIKNQLKRSSEQFPALIRKHLYDFSVYGKNFGGSLESLARISIKQAKRYHSTYYHPSNAFFFHYGDIPIADVMKNVNSELQKFQESKLPSIDHLLVQDKWKNPRYMIIDGPEDNSSLTYKSAIAWQVSDLRNYSDIVDLEILSLLLTNSTASPLYKGLIQRGIGSKFIHTGFMPYIRSPYFSIGLEGVNASNPNISSHVLTILNQIFADGFEKQKLQGILYMYGLNDRSDNKGMRIWKNVISTWIHGVNPINNIDKKWEIERIKSILAVQPKYFEILLKNKLINNPHRLELVVKPSKSFYQSVVQNVKENLDEIADKLSEADKDKIIEETERLKDMSTKRNSHNIKIDDIPIMQ